MIYGQLQDPYREFMIFKELETPSLKGKEVSESNYVHDTSSFLIDKKVKCNTLLNTGIKEKDTWNSVFFLDLQKVPSYISAQTAQLVLFIGRAVSTFRSSSHSQPYHNEKIETNLKDILSPLLHTDHFNVTKFEQVIIQANETIVNILWLLIVNEANLVDHLHTMRQVYLLGSGIFSTEFISSFNCFFFTPFRKNMARDIQEIFRKTLVTVLPDDTESFQRLYLQLETTSEVADDNHLRKGWESHLYLNYSINWPLNLLFSPSIIERYNKIFKFVLAVRRVQLALHQTWRKQQRFYKSLTTYQSSIWMEMCHIRYQMTFFIDLLQIYIQDEVIEINHKNLIHTIGTSHDFDQLCRALDHYVSTLFSYCFLHVNSIHHSFYDIFDAILGFCAYIERVPNCPSKIILSNRSEFTRFQEVFHQNVSLLFQKFSNVQGNLSNPHLTQFLLRLDFNHYYGRLSDS